MKAAFEAAGDIRGVDLLAAFVGIWRDNSGGSVRFSRQGSSSGFEFSGGSVVRVFASDPRFETSAILVRAAKLDAGALERLSVPPGTDAALAALQAGILTRREWKWGEKIRAIEILSDLLGWPDGKFLFDPEARPAAGEWTLPIPRLILELFLRSRDRGLIEHQLGPMDRSLVQSENFEKEFATFGLTADAESVVRLIDGDASAGQISERAPAEEFAVLKLLAALATLGLVRPTEAAAERWVPDSAAKPPLPEVVLPVLEDAPAPSREGVGGRGQAGREAESLDDFSAEEAESEAGVAIEPSLATEDAVLSGSEPLQSSDWDSTPVAPEWEEAPQEILESPPPLTQPFPPPDRPRGRRWLLAGVLGAGVLAVAAILLRRSDIFARAGGSAGDPILSPVPAAAPPTIAAAVPRAKETETAGATAVDTLPTIPLPTATRTALPRPSRLPTIGVPRSVSAGGAGPSREEWTARARRDRRRLDSEPATRYAIQLLLACEVPSLVDAWRYDRPAGSLWLLATPHQGRDCFRVLWGRYATLDAARRAKSGIPPSFATPTNRPAVVSIR